MIMITPLPGVTTTKPGSATKPFPGVEAGVVNEEGEEVEPGGGGYLVLERPWPAMTRGIFGDDARFRATYWERFPGVYFAGDGARIDADGDFWLLGRVDDVMNVSGHRISTIEVESALVDHPEGRRGRGLRPRRRADGPGDRRLRDAQGRHDRARSRCSRSCATTSRAKIGPIAKPANIVFTPELPKTRSGKIMRRLLRDVAEHRPLGDTTTLADPAVVSEIAERAARDTGGRRLAPRSARAKAATVRSTSRSLVRQPTTEMRIVNLPVPGGRAHPRLALLLDGGEDRLRPLVVLEPEEHLVEHDVVDDLAARQRRRALRRCARACAQQRSTSAGIPSRPSSRIAAHTGTARARRENSGL